MYGKGFFNVIFAFGKFEYLLYLAVFADDPHMYRIVDVAGLTLNGNACYAV